MVAKFILYSVIEFLRLSRWSCIKAQIYEKIYTFLTGDFILSGYLMDGKCQRGCWLGRKSENPSITRDVSGEGVQRDLLPLLEGTTVMTRHGAVKTEHIFFVAAGTFSQNKPSEIIPELQGRFPLRVELSPLSQQDLERILTEPHSSLIKQYQALLATEGVDLVFTEDGVREIARLVVLMNERNDNIGARRLYTIMEKLLEDLSFAASEKRDEQAVVDANYVFQQVGGLIKDENLSRYIL